MLCNWEHSLPSKSSEKSPVLGEMRSFQLTEGKARHRAWEAEVFRNEAPCRQDPVLPPRGSQGRSPASPQPCLSPHGSLCGGDCRASPLLLPVHWSVVLSSELTAALLVVLDIRVLSPVV